PPPPRPPLFPYTTLFRSEPPPSPAATPWMRVVTRISSFSYSVLSAWPSASRPALVTAYIESNANDSMVASLDVLTMSPPPAARRSEEHTSELQSRGHLVC